MIIGIMGAMPDEVDQLCAKLEQVTKETYAGVEYCLAWCFSLSDFVMKFHILESFFRLELYSHYILVINIAHCNQIFKHRQE